MSETKGLKLKVPPGDRKAGAVRCAELRQLGSETDRDGVPVGFLEMIDHVLVGGVAVRILNGGVDGGEHT